MSLRTVATFVRNRLSNLPVALVSTLSGLFILMYLYSHDLYFLNYREEDFWDLLYLWLAVCALLHSLGVYSSAWLFERFCSRRELVVKPALLMIGGVIGGFMGLMIQQAKYPISDFDFISSWIGVGVGSLLGIQLGCLAKRRRTSGQAAILRQAAVPVVLIFFLYLVNYSGFPGVNASAQSRQQWGARTFTGYEELSSRLRSCEAIADRVSSVEFVAPTKGKNVVTIEDGYRYMGELTLEVIGATGTGVANFEVYLGSIVRGELTFTSKGKAEALSCGI